MLPSCRGIAVLASALAFTGGCVDTSGLAAAPSNGGAFEAGTSDARDVPDGSDASIADDATDAGAGDAHTADAADSSENPPCPADPKLELCLRFEDAVVDESSNGVTPDSAANLTFEPGLHGKAARFKTSLPVSDLSFGIAYFEGARTIEVWVKPTSTSRMTLVDVRDDFALIIESGTLRCRQPELTSTIALTMNDWNHVACTLDGNTLRAYVNGVPAGTLASTNTVDNSGATGIGQDMPGGTTRYDGVLDDVRIWSSTRTAAQIAEAAKR